MTWLERVLHRGELERQLDAELRFHFDEHVAANIRKGMSEPEARRAARLEFGGLEQVKEECRDARGFQLLDSLLQDVRFALRTFRRNPGFAVVAVATLAIGIGINAAVFTVTNTILFKGFPLVYRNDRLLYISGNGGMSWPDFADWRAQAKSFEGMAAVADRQTSLNDNIGFAETCAGTRISSNAFQLVHQRPILGRDFTASDEIPGASPVVMLSYSLWERRYAKDPAIIGQTVRLNGAPATVIGVMPQGFTFPQKQDLWVPLTPTPEMQKRDARGLWFAAGRLKDGVGIQSARAEMQTIGKRLEKEWPLTNHHYIPNTRTFAESFIGVNAVTLYGSMWAAVGFVLLIACANLANLLLARAIGRSREISIRMAIGAGRWRIVRQLLIESLLLSALGGLFGFWLARWGVRVYSLLANPPSWFAGVVDYSIDGRVLAYLIAISIGTGLLFGLAPALRLSRLGVNTALKDGGHRATLGGRRNQLSALLVAGEMALAVVLLAGGGVIVRSFLKMYTADLGFNTAKLVTMQVGLPVNRYLTGAARISFFDRMQQRLEAIPGVQSATIVDHLPMYGSGHVPYELADAPPAGEQSRPRLSAMIVGPSYFRTLGATVISGRDFNESDGASGPPVAIVNQRFATQHWPGENPMGKRLRLFNGNTTEGRSTPTVATVAGVVSNIVQYGPTRPDLDALVYLPYRETPAGFMFVVVRTRIEPGAVTSAIRREAQAIDPDLAISYFMPLTERLAWTYAFNGSIAALFLIFAAIAFLLASVGLYAVIAHSMSRRTQEIGVRMALGATSRDILKLVFKQGMLPVGIGLATGIAASFAVNRLLRAELVQVSPRDPITLVLAPAVLLLSATLGCLIPARRAMRVDPVVALRYE